MERLELENEQWHFSDMLSLTIEKQEASIGKVEGDVELELSERVDVQERNTRSTKSEFCIETNAGRHISTPSQHAWHDMGKLFMRLLSSSVPISEDINRDVEWARRPRFDCRMADNMRNMICIERRASLLINSSSLIREKAYWSISDTAASSR